MDRIAFQLGAITIYWYGIFVSLGFVVAYLVMHWKAGKMDIPQHKVSDLCFAAMIGGILGARVFYVILNYGEYASNPIEIIRIDHGGLVFYGGFFGAMIALVWLIKKLGLSFWAVADLFALALPLGQSIGRIGCLINGCCFGRPSTSWFSYQYPADSAIWITQVHKHQIAQHAKECLPVLPVQLFQSGINLVIWGILLFMAPKVKHQGQLFSFYLILYSVGRFFNEFNRGDYLTYYWGLTISQLICLLLAPLGLILFYKSPFQSREIKLENLKD